MKAFLLDLLLGLGVVGCVVMMCLFANLFYAIWNGKD